jgi:23S rRNA (cytidine1920-2'-O)/16S rRNA (cytidine1409-2'-O)-methyltransferase
VTTPRRRLDAELVRRGLCATRSYAQERIAAGEVLVSGAVADKAGRLVGAGEPIVMLGAPARFVGRGGEKLDHALSVFALDVAGRRAIDVGASTGGFTDCLLQRGARGVVALDVGRGQLHERLRNDDRVRVLERCNVRTLGPESSSAAERDTIVGPPADIVVVDVSFISLRVIMSALDALLADGGDLVTLVKPQFEAGRSEASRGEGIISDPTVWHRVLTEVADAATGQGLGVVNASVSPLRGGGGNVEFLLHLQRGPTQLPAGWQASVVEQAHLEQPVAPVGPADGDS